MIKGHVNIDFITDDMLEELVFTEKTETREAGGYWNTLGISTPNFPVDADIVYQTFGDSCPSWVNNVKYLFDNWLKYSMVTINKLTPGCFIPPHKDKFHRLFEFAKNNNIDLTNKEPIRINLFLQDHKIGHFFEMENEVCMNYKKGDYAIIRLDKIHSVINIGNENRYTLQVSGFADKDTFK
ncbi:hypothetical protein C7K08_13065 [Synechococcus lacustris str. Tous]|uniref:Aspartyl/asparaginy/proline hydroxylase domain-containing protein n=2 Tax=Synechococcus TaxID=1129 RepID=A0A2P7EB60_9SYNE|nr:hypothetical protein C7K08_13065 [Synechococcus lacustris str. Tous]